MNSKKDYWVSKRKNGDWEVKKEGAKRATSVHDTQKEAWSLAKNHARKVRSEAFLKDKTGQIRERNTYGKDTYPPKG